MSHLLLMQQPSCWVWQKQHKAWWHKQDAGYLTNEVSIHTVSVYLYRYINYQLAKFEIADQLDGKSWSFMTFIWQPFPFKLKFEVIPNSNRWKVMLRQMMVHYEQILHNDITMTYHLLVVSGRYTEKSIFQLAYDQPVLQHIFIQT